MKNWCGRVRRVSYSPVHSPVSVNFSSTAEGALACAILVAVACLVWTAVLATPWALLGLIASPVAGKAVRTVLGSAAGMALIPVLRDTGIAQLLYAVGLAAGFWISR